MSPLVDQHGQPYAAEQPRWISLSTASCAPSVYDWIHPHPLLYPQWGTFTVPGDPIESPKPLSGYERFKLRRDYAVVSQDYVPPPPPLKGWARFGAWVFQKRENA